MTVFLVLGEQVAYIADLVTSNHMLFSIADFNIKEWTRTMSLNPIATMWRTSIFSSFLELN